MSVSIPAPAKNCQCCGSMIAATNPQHLIADMLVCVQHGKMLAKCARACAALGTGVSVVGNLWWDEDEPIAEQKTTKNSSAALVKLIRTPEPFSNLRNLSALACAGGPRVCPCISDQPFSRRNTKIKKLCPIYGSKITQRLLKASLWPTSKTTAAFCFDSKGALPSQEFIRLLVLAKFHIGMRESRLFKAPAM